MVPSLISAVRNAMQWSDWSLDVCSSDLYAGCVGYFSAGEEMDTCIVLRTALIKDEIGRASCRERV